jgi:hypothetical protein
MPNPPPIVQQAWRIAIPRHPIPLTAGGSVIQELLPPGPNTVQQDPGLYPPPNSIPINVSLNTAIVGAGATFQPAGLAFSVPQSSFGVISVVQLLLDGITIASNVLWTMLINGQPVPGFNPITILGRNGAASVAKTWGPQLRVIIPLGGTISWLIQDVDGGAYTAGVSYYGWQVPQTR